MLKEFHEQSGIHKLYKLKLRISKKGQNILKKISLFVLTYLSTYVVISIQRGRFFFKLCGFLTISELFNSKNETSKGFELIVFSFYFASLVAKCS